MDGKIKFKMINNCGVFSDYDGKDWSDNQNYVYLGEGNVIYYDEHIMTFDTTNDTITYEGTTYTRITDD